MRQDRVVEFILRRSAHALRHLAILGCFLGGNNSLYFLHPRDPISQAELLLPISTLWVQECRLRGYSHRFNRALETAAKILDFNPASGPESE